MSVGLRVPFRDNRLLQDAVAIELIVVGNSNGATFILRVRTCEFVCAVLLHGPLVDWVLSAS